MAFICFKTAHIIANMAAHMYVHIYVHMAAHMAGHTAAHMALTSYMTEFPHRSATPGDSGSYECQVSAEPKLSRMVSLEVQGKACFV